MKDYNKEIVSEVKTVVDEIIRLKVIIGNLNERIISKSDKQGILSYLNTKKLKLLEICTLISGLEVEILEKEEGV